MSYLNEIIAIGAVILLAWAAWVNKIKPELDRRDADKKAQPKKTVQSIDATFTEVPK